MAINTAKIQYLLLVTFVVKFVASKVAVLYTTYGKCVLYVEADFATDIMTLCDEILQCLHGKFYIEQEAIIPFNKSKPCSPGYL